MLSNDNYKSNIAFIDMLFNILIGFVFLFIIAFILINPKDKKEDVKAKAEFVIILEWPDSDRNDVDLWVMDPTGEKIGFRNKQGSLSHLDRDDLGDANDTVKINGRTVDIKGNKEMVSVRGLIAGEYYVTAHLYRRRDVEYNDKNEVISSPKPIPVRVEVLKLNPYEPVYTKVTTLKEEGQYYNFPSFKIDNEGNVILVRETPTLAIPAVNLRRSENPGGYPGN